MIEHAGAFVSSRHKNVPASCHPITDLLSLVGDKWTVQVVGLLGGGGAMRFNGLKRSIGGISQRMLTRTLRALERDGMLNRTVFLSVPARVDYQLTDLGLSLYPLLKALGLWALENYAVIETARVGFDTDLHSLERQPAL